MVATQAVVLSPFPHPAYQDDHGPADNDAVSILNKAREVGPPDGAHYHGSVTPEQAWALFSARAALLVDVRTAEEYRFVGHVPESILLPWLTGTSMLKNPRFVRELEQKAKKDDVLLLLCRSARRSAAAAEAAVKAGFTAVFNVLEGFEGELDDNGQRGNADGWRFRRLPWTQD
jgi:rhodanese-related sulfurtransferase